MTKIKDKRSLYIAPLENPAGLAILIFPKFENSVRELFNLNAKGYFLGLLEVGGIGELWDKL